MQCETIGFFVFFVLLNIPFARALPIAARITILSFLSKELETFRVVLWATFVCPTIGTLKIRRSIIFRTISSFSVVNSWIRIHSSFKVLGARTNGFVRCWRNSATTTRTHCSFVDISVCWRMAPPAQRRGLAVNRNRRMIDKFTARM